MSGPLTVPFTIVAFFVSAATYKSLFAGLAVVAAMITCYRIWASEYDQLEEAKQRILAYEDRAKAFMWMSHFAGEANGLVVNSPNEDATKMEIVRWRQQVEVWKDETTAALSHLSPVAEDKFLNCDITLESANYTGKHREVWSDLAILDERRGNLTEIMEKADVYLAKVI
jgi:hypothetical protein